MELYTLDSQLRRIQVIDKFDSLIWTERYADVGDFELDITSTPTNRTLFSAGTRLAINTSYRVMTIESTENTTDSDNKSILKVKGRSLEAILEDRAAKDTMANTAVEPQWILTGTPGNIARTMFNDICVTGNLDTKDIIPYITAGNIFPADTIPEPTGSITWTQDPDTLLNAIKAICDAYNLGFRLVRNFDQSQLYFNIYTGRDRTTAQTALPQIVFSGDLDNVQNTTELTTIQHSKNVAYVLSDVGTAIVYPDDVDPSISGFQRRVLIVKTSDVTASTPDIPGALALVGKQELAKNRGQSIFDGEINQHSTFTYGVDYALGDLVEMRNTDGVHSNRRISEQIFVCDGEGERSYPTLSANAFVGS